MTKLLKDVAVVIPVFNEEELIGECIDEWLKILNSINLRYEILIIDDGSSDATTSIVERYGDTQNIQTITKPNEGHGPTIEAGNKGPLVLLNGCFRLTVITKSIQINSLLYGQNGKEKMQLSVGVKIAIKQLSDVS